MMFITKEWADWVRVNLERNCNPNDIFNELVKSGHEPELSFELAYQRKVMNEDEKPDYEVKNWYTKEGNKVNLPDKTVEVLSHITDPEIILFGNFLSDEECNSLIELSKARLVESKVIDSATGGDIKHEARTSNNSFFQYGETELLKTIENRIAQLLNIPMENGEALQVLNYSPGKEYKAHFDYFSPKNAESIHMKKGGQRVGTFIMYLNDVEEGGETSFPELNIKICPKKGNALFFSYCNDKTQTDKRTLHAGNPVIVGSKWISTKWLRQSSLYS